MDEFAGHLEVAADLLDIMFKLLHEYTVMDFTIIVQLEVKLQE